MKKELKKYADEIFEIQETLSGRPIFWPNKNRQSGERATDTTVLTAWDIKDAEARLRRFAPYIAKVFPETSENSGLIESPLREIDRMKQVLEEKYHFSLPGRLLLKMDSHLAIAGSIKARGGIYEVLKHAEKLALENGLLKETDNYAILAEQPCIDLFRQYTVQVSSTGNLGLSIGMMSAKLGFQVIVHMSSDAKAWKKELLRHNGVTVKEYAADYSAAVIEGRKNSDTNPLSYFVDDESSKDLFLGYSVAAERLKEQLAQQNIIVDQEHPLIVYLPCGVGGAPGGITFGLKTVFGDAVHCFFVEPVNACCMFLGMATGLHDEICVQDFGISGRTHADGLAVGRPSAFVGRFIEPMLSGILTLNDHQLYDHMRALIQSEDIFIEPSACACFAFAALYRDIETYCKAEGLTGVMNNATHIAWATGGSMVPPAMVDEYKNMFLCEP